MPRGARQPFLARLLLKQEGIVSAIVDLLLGWGARAGTRAPRQRAARLGLGLGVALSWAVACGSDRGALSDGGDGEDGAGTGGTSGGPPAGTGGTPEVELEENFRAPVASGSYLWTANPESNRVAVIHAGTLAIEVLEGGDGPTFLAALPSGAPSSGAPSSGAASGSDRGEGALVINVRGGDASIFRRSREEGFGGASGDGVSVERVRVQKGASAWAVGASGRFAVAWSRFQDDLKGPLDGYQELTVLDLSGAAARATKLSVGFRPSQVRINREETRAYAVCQPGISVIDLEAEPPVVVREILLPEVTDGLARDVSLTPDGRLALVRLSGSSRVLVVDTEDDSRTTLELPRQVTDLDLSGDGALAVAVMRGDPAPPAGQGGEGGGGEGGEGGESHGGAPLEVSDTLVALLPIPGILSTPDAFEIVRTSDLFGSAVVSGDGSVALLYTNAVASATLGILDLGALDLRTVNVTAPVQAAFLTPDAEHAVTVMTPPPGSKLAGAFALVPVAETLPVRIEGTETVPRFVSVADHAALLTTWGSATRPAVSLLGRFPSLIVDAVELGSEPLASGLLLAENQGFVSQAHPQGQVTFVDLDSGEPRTVTGFELSSQVVDR